MTIEMFYNIKVYYRYDSMPVGDELRERLEGVTHLVEHPTQMKPPGQYTS